jgi:hypothetical protein
MGRLQMPSFFMRKMHEAECTQLPTPAVNEIRHKRRKQNLITKLMLRTSVSRRVDGLWIGAFMKNADAEPVLQRVEEALDLIKTYDLPRYQRLIRDLDRIWVTVLPDSLAHFSESIRACVLDERHVRNEANSLGRIALSIVHEATHARLQRCGIGYDGEELRARVEAVCFRSERRFAAKLPNGHQLCQLADQYLGSYANPEHWTDEAFHTRYEKGVVEATRYLGFPDWLPKVFRPIRLLRASLGHHATPTPPPCAR